MENLPLYIPAVFVAATILTLFILYRAAQRSLPVLAASTAWLTLQGAVGLSGFYTTTNTLPPRLALAVLPPLFCVVLLRTTSGGKRFLNGLDAKWLTLLHIVRVPVEMVLFWLFVQKYVPQLMTFEGRNFDILSGLTAPLVFYFGFVKKTLRRTVLLLWNFLCLALLLNIVVTAILSAPFPFQRFAFNQPNVAIFYFPFVWLPAFVVPAVLLAHLASIFQLLRKPAAPVVLKADPRLSTV